jgi:putative pyruvate formate lyase activating enzyme
MLEPSYLRLYETGELRARAERLEAMLASCDICPRDCRIDRLRDEVAACHSGYLPVVSSYTPHFGEEPPLVGKNGAGNIFFGNCNLRCVYCQNYQISQRHREQRANEVSFERLSEMMLDLQGRGCHNINFVSPTHFVPQMVKALLIAVEQGLRLPIVYNTNAYDAVQVLRLLDGIVDIYLPDLKYSHDEAGWKYSKIDGYVGHARAALREMYRQVGPDLIFDDQGLLRRGLIVRLLVLPNDQAGLRDSLLFLRDELSPKVALSVMAQYFPANQATVERNPLLSRRIMASEYGNALDLLSELGLEEGWVQEFESADYYRPDFTDADVPFKDIRDFQGPLSSAYVPTPSPLLSIQPAAD